MTDICASPLYSNQTICEVMRQIEDFVAKSEYAYDDAQAKLAELGTITEGIASGLEGIDYDPGTSGIDFNYVAPSSPDFSALGPTAPSAPDAPTEAAPDIPAAPTVPDGYVVPDANTPLIDTPTLNAIYNREQERLSRLGAKGERDAMYRAARLGLGGSTSALQLGLQEAEEKTRQDVSDVARDKATGEGVMLREDVKTLHDMHIRSDLEQPKLELESYRAEHGMEVDAYQALTSGFAAINNGLAAIYQAEVAQMVGYLGEESKRLQALIASEQVNARFTDLEARSAMEEADKLTKYAIEKSMYISEITRKSQEAQSALITGYLQALVSAASVHLSGSGSQSVSETV